MMTHPQLRDSQHKLPSKLRWPLRTCLDRGKSRKSMFKCSAMRYVDNHAVGAVSDQS